nr:PREDICTED: mitochondrial ribonuclease P protein 3 isoform X2 [Megachile rotundata]
MRYLSTRYRPREENCMKAAKNYYEFLEANNYNIPVSALQRYLTLYASSKIILTNEEKVHISSVCKKIMDQHKHLPAVVASTVINSLCKVDELDKAIMVLKEFESYDSKILIKAYPSLIVSILANGNLTMAQEYLDRALQEGTAPNCKIYDAYLRFCLRDRNTFNENIEKLFLLWRKYGTKPLKRSIIKYMEACNELGWSVKFMTKSDSLCNNCHQIVEETELSEEEYKRLHEAIAQNVVTNNAYRTSDPQELNAFIRFIKYRRYDYVIDGLNVMCSVTPSPQHFASLLRALKKEGKKVLVIGRHHIQKTIMNRDLQDTADYFYVNDLSNDDAFVLHATFLSGNGTNIISQDLMRQHKFTFSSIELEVLFKRWQMVHQYTVRKNTNILEKLHTHTYIDSYVVKKNNCWHIPCVKTSQALKPQACDTWVCFKMSN